MSDFLMVLRRALVSAIDTASGLVAVTGRASGNVVAWESRADAVRPCIAYKLDDVQRAGGIGDTRRCRVLWRAIADTEETAHELLGAVDAALTWSALANATPSVDAYREYAVDDRTPVGFDDAIDGYSADLTTGLVVSIDLSLPVVTPVGSLEFTDVFALDFVDGAVTDVAELALTDVFSIDGVLS